MHIHIDILFALYVIKFVSDCQLSHGTPVSSTNKTDSNKIPEILLKVALTHNRNPIFYSSFQNNDTFLNYSY